MSTEGSEPDGTPLVELRGVKKSFGAVQAVTGVNLEVLTGKVTALVGDNGAGKSSLIKTISGLWEPDEGEILWEGKPVRLRAPKDAEALGITTIYQDLALCDNLDIVQNMFLGHEVLRHFTLDEGTMEITAEEDPGRARGHDRPLHPPARGLALGRAAPVGGGGQGGHVQRQAGHHGRADRRPRRVPDRPGARPHQATGRQRRHRVDDLAQPQRHLRGGRPDRRPAPRPHRGQGPVADFDSRWSWTT